VASYIHHTFIKDIDDTLLKASKVASLESLLEASSFVAKDGNCTN